MKPPNPNILFRSSVPRFSPSSLLGSQHQPPGHHLPHIKGDFDSSTSGVVSRKESRQSKFKSINCADVLCYAVEHRQENIFMTLPLLFILDKKKETHIKKPLNAFMLYMKEMRPVVQAECTLKESAAINQLLGRRVSSMTSPVMRYILAITACIQPTLEYNPSPFQKYFFGFLFSNRTPFLVKKSTL